MYHDSVETLFRPISLAFTTPLHAYSETLPILFSIGSLVNFISSYTPSEDKKPSKKATGVGTKAKKTVTPKTRDTANSPDEKVLYVLAEFHAVGMTEPSREIVAARAGYKSLQTKAVRGCFQKNGHLASSGKITLPSATTISITSAGLKSVGPITDKGKMSNEEFLNLISTTFFNSPFTNVKVLNILSDGATYSVTDLLKKTGYQREDTKAFREPISLFKKLGYLEMSKEKGIKMYRLADKAFLHGRPN